MQKIALIGCPGSGKTTLANTLGEMLGIPVYHLDKIMWLDNYQPVKYATFLEEANTIIAKQRWIIDGNFTKSIPERLQQADTIIFFDVPKVISLWRIVKRSFQLRGKIRPDVGGKNTALVRWSLIRFILKFDSRVIYQMLETVPENSRVVVIKRNKDVQDLLHRLSA